MLNISCIYTNTHTETFAPLITLSLITYHHWWRFAQNHARHQSSTASVHRRTELGIPTATFLSIFCSQVSSDLCCWVQKIWWNKSRTGICHSRRLIVSHVPWAAAGTLHCWKVKNTAQISRIAGSSV